MSITAVPLNVASDVQPLWMVIRTDETGNNFLVESGLTEAGAHERVGTFTGHKQNYGRTICARYARRSAASEPCACLTNQDPDRKPRASLLGVFCFLPLPHHSEMMSIRAFNSGSDLVQSPEHCRIFEAFLLEKRLFINVFWRF
jgi:hypothetical protein